jgi:transposase InsO family protein
MKAKRQKGPSGSSDPTPGSAADELPERWSVQRKTRLAHRGYAASGKRVLRLMRAHGLLAPRRLGPPNGNPAHDGTITTDRPDGMWGTDGTRFYTAQEGWCWFFGAIDHHVAKQVTHFPATAGWNVLSGSVESEVGREYFYGARRLKR